MKSQNRSATFLLMIFGLFTLFTVVAYELTSYEIVVAEVDTPYTAHTNFNSTEIKASEPVTFTILHTNDFHGHLQPDNSNRGGSAHMATVINNIRTAEGSENVLLMDAGDVYLGAAAISQLSLGESTIDIYNMLGYDVAAYGNHAFDKGQTVLISRTQQSNFPWLGANIVVAGTDWAMPSWAKPYHIQTVGPTGSEVKLGILGLITDGTPANTLKGVTDGLEFKDLTETVLHYYDELQAQSDAIIILAHMGQYDGGSFKGMNTVAQELVDAGKPVDLIIAGHQHEVLNQPVWVGNTAIIQAGYHGQFLGRADVTVNPVTKKLSLVDYDLLEINTSIIPDAAVEARVDYWAGQVQAVVDQPVGSTFLDLTRASAKDSLVGNLVTDGMRWKADLYDDNEINGSVRIAFTNAGGLRADINIPDGASLPYDITWGTTFDVMPFGNTLVLMDLTGAQIQAILNDASANPNGMIQNSGITWSWFNDCSCSSPTTWGTFNIQVDGEPLVLSKTYRIVTNNYLAPIGIYAQGTNRWDTYYDMQEGVNEYIGTLTPIDATDIENGRITQLSQPPSWIFLPLITHE